MKSKLLWTLIIANALLAAALIGRSTKPNAAFAQNRGARPGDYVMIPGEVTGGSSSVVYIVDTSNGWLGALAYDDSIKQLQTMPGRIDLAQVFSQIPPAPTKEEKKGYKRP